MSDEYKLVNLNSNNVQKLSYGSLAPYINTCNIICVYALNKNTHEKFNFIVCFQKEI